MKKIKEHLPYLKDKCHPNQKKITQWYHFDKVVKWHIVEYTNAQYNDYPNDEQWVKMTLPEVKSHLLKYINRIAINIRGKEESARDALKIAHYSALLFWLCIKEMEEDDK